MAILSKLISLLTIVRFTSAVYFEAEPDKWRCFLDTVVTNYVIIIQPSTFLLQTLEMEVQILDEDVLSGIVEANEQMTTEGSVPNQGVRMRLVDENDT